MRLLHDPLFDATLIWAAWGLSWMAARWWQAKAEVTADAATYRWQLWTAFAGYLCLFLEAPYRRHVLWQLPPAVAWSMVALVVVGMAFAWWARIHLGALWSGLIVRREGHRIVDTGPYALVRHPIYTGLILGAFALAAIKATPLSIIGASLIAVGFGVKAKVEERFLAAELGEADYAAYRQRVPMLVPFAPF
jgi:protein-S-isoprenylcysteine O-methyltransferase Ste14